jgi:chemotaxis protein CheX
MLKTDIIISKPYVKVEDDRNADVAAVIGFSGGATGSVALCFPSRSAVAAASKFAGVPLTETDPDFADALGELANMVAGQAKSKLHGLEITISLPRVIVAQKLNVLSSRAQPVLGLPCDSPLGRFNVEVGMVVAKKHEGADATPAPAQAEA